MDATIREAAPDDAHAIRAVHNESIEGLAGEAYDRDVVAEWAHDRDPDEYPISSDNTYFLVAERGASIVGFGWMKPDADEYFREPVDGEITAVYVHPSVAGEGLGSRLYGRLEAYARERDVSSLGLWASLNAVPFYDAMGFERVVEHAHEFDENVTGTIVEMRKSIG